MMSYPPRRMWDIWKDPDYAECRNKSEVLLMAAIDYALKTAGRLCGKQASKTIPQKLRLSFR